MKILYIIHTDWSWIKQRSQFLAENLNSHYQVKVIYKFSFRRRTLTTNPSELVAQPYPFLPFFLRKNYFLTKFDHILGLFFVNIYTKIFAIDCVVVTHPLMYKYIPKRLPFIYDLHDDNSEFYPNGWLKKLISSENLTCLGAAAAVLFSSEYLKSRYNSENSSRICDVIRNAHSLKEYPMQAQVKIKKNSKLKIFYFGTISEWFRFDLVSGAISKFDNIEFHIIGPSDVKLPMHDRIIYYGSLNHNKMVKISMSADAFIMPFEVNELIKGVDPVKFYEYIAFNKPIFTPFYKEIEGYRDFVQYYDSDDSFYDLVSQFSMGKISSPDRIKSVGFLNKSRWSDRALQFKEIVDKVVL